ncbi:putative kinase, aspartokinase/uridylate kinase [Methanomethylovorans hollandica DSM 15978]|uniref:Putative kinase, aspartokinase/uridylate kinase n=1 Tax=Methanomethylovorans hollandica (strain DSM 15978 / NBRC 107637 / DMS1) TaxID=867904 RepID=L0KYV5_METHD|nr:kinase aspartokinase/uridylate kinase [Methanomethylovorans hollandica]AGB49179.1 putative kinase, aspartokinase/uridylate kinase [Methanomethylovorans hollandica DSM 15978]
MTANVKDCTVIKVGGSLIETAPELLFCLQEHITHMNSPVPTLLIVPGGGVFADNIRDIHENKCISDDAAHWMAILGMEQYAYYLSDKSGIAMTDDLDELVAGISVLKPYRLLLNRDPLPHSWDVTSDCIAAWVASILNARMIKVTDVDGVRINGETVPVVHAVKLTEMRESCVDRMLPELLMQEGRDCVVVNGKYPERVLAALEEKAVIGTLIKGNI